MNFHKSSKFGVLLLSVFLTACGPFLPLLACAGTIMMSPQFYVAAGGDPEPGEGAFFNPDVDAAASVQAIFTEDVNAYGGGSALLVDDPNPRPGTTKSVRIRYTADDAGVELKPPPFPATQTLFVRKYVRFSSNWTGNWPVGLKTSRYFTKADFTTGGGTETNDAWAYMSEKLVWQSYEGDPDDDYGRGVGYSVFEFEPEPSSQFTADQLFANGLPYYRPDTWYKWETFVELNSADGVANGRVRIWVDGVLVHDRNDLPFVESARGIPNGLAGFQSMWFGGNYSGADFGYAEGETFDRYENGFYLSTTLDR